MVVNSLYYNSPQPFKAEQTTISISDEVLSAALQSIYSQNPNPTTPTIEPNLFAAISKTLLSAITAPVPGASAPGLDPILPALRHSIDVFSAFKVHRAQNDMAARLLDSNGNLKPFEQWKAEVLPIASHQCGAWLETEYNTAVLRARQTAQWQQFLAEKDVLPNLKWLPSTSPNPGADHRLYWNTILPIDHPFWDQHRPGDRWNCKCSLTSTDEPPTPVPSTTAPVPDVSTSGNNPHPGLAGNPAKTRAIFSQDHPYFPKDCNHCAFYKPNVKSRLRSLFKAQTKDCYNCPNIDDRIDGIIKVNRKAAIHIKEIKPQIHKYQGMVIKDNNFITREMRVLRRTLDDIKQHNIEDGTLMKWLSDFSFDDLRPCRYEGWAENRPYSPDDPKYDPQNPDKKKHEEAICFLYYSLIIGKKKYWANVKLHKYLKGEVLYTIESKKPDDIILGLPIYIKNDGMR